MATEAEMGPLFAPVSEGDKATTTPSPTAVSRLVTLPEELLSNIAVKLGSDDIFSLRLTCRDVYAKVRAVSTRTL